ncbi:MAG: hypothetical protein C0190_00760 [Thermodesulfobacterium geofontis]|uniref:Uncharacterized protein n=1 Tax=Thermodesulfobacterium geofontis TaxID=1295609 RepID=A0A2N7QGB8_9BACT|nr:MAG: hypothetical protein C0190_00760 [Thermodesulfobacterium geofontis]PMP98031.1 MAG: hypothetical protein C0169_00980 [Thermodesulfobacterium geofontis]
MFIREEVLREAEVIKYEGGEIPEVFFWNSYFYLTEPPPKGLGLNLTKEEIQFLKKAVIERYLEIIKRDLTPENIEKPFYRGIKRVIINLRRLKNFAEKEGLESDFRAGLEKIKNWFKIFKTQKSNFQKEKIKELEELLRSF